MVAYIPESYDTLYLFILRLLLIFDIQKVSLEIDLQGPLQSLVNDSALHSSFSVPIIVA